MVGDKEGREGIVPEHAVCMFVGVVCGCVVASSLISMCSFTRTGLPSRAKETYLSHGKTFAQQLNLFYVSKSRIQTSQDKRHT